jgi:hypothetical protein
VTERGIADADIIAEVTADENVVDDSEELEDTTEQLDEMRIVSYDEAALAVDRAFAYFETKPVDLELLDKFRDVKFHIEQSRPQCMPSQSKITRYFQPVTR